MGRQGMMMAVEKKDRAFVIISILYGFKGVVS